MGDSIRGFGAIPWIPPKKSPPLLVPIVGGIPPKPPRIKMESWFNPPSSYKTCFRTAPYMVVAKTLVELSCRKACHSTNGVSTLQTADKIIETDWSALTLGQRIKHLEVEANHSLSMSVL